MIPALTIGDIAFNVPHSAVRTTNDGPCAGGEDGIADMTAGLVAGDDEAFRRFHERFHERVWRYLIVVCRGDEDAAQEAVQDTWLRVARRARPFQAEDDLWRWVAALARSAAVDGARRRIRYRGALSRFLSFCSNGPGGASLQETTEEEDSGTLDRLDGLLEEGLTEFPEVDRLLMVARYRTGRSVRELADEHEMSEKAMESRLGRLRQRLRQRLLERLSHEDSP